MTIFDRIMRTEIKESMLSNETGFILLNCSYRLIKLFPKLNHKLQRMIPGIIGQGLSYWKITKPTISYQIDL